MKKILVTGTILILIGKFAFAQCASKEIILEGFQFSNNKHPEFNIDNDPYATAYTFYANGDVYNAGHYLLKNTMDIKEASANTSKLKHIADNAIKAYAGKLFFSDVHFLSASVEYPSPGLIADSVLENNALYKKDTVLRKLHKLDKEGRNNYRYSYTYEFKADSLSSYPFTLVIDRTGRVVRNFYFPSKYQYKPVNKHFTYCRLINIARKAQKHIDPIESIRLSYNISEKRFYWFITQHVGSRDQDGQFKYNIVEIDAANISRVKRRTGTLMVGPSVSDVSLNKKSFFFCNTSETINLNFIQAMSNI